VIKYLSQLFDCFIAEDLVKGV